MTLTKAIEQLMADARVPGLAAAVVREGEVVLAEGFGVTATEGGRPVTPDTHFRIGSVTKPLTATAIMRLVDAGRVDLDHPISAYVPALRLADPAAPQQITMRMLLTHTSGLPTMPVSFHGPRDPGGLERYVHVDLPQLPLTHLPGRVYAYSNPGYALAGFIAATTSGLPFATLMQQTVFNPLGMASSTLDPLMAATYPLALGHVPSTDGQLQVRRPDRRAHRLWAGGRCLRQRHGPRSLCPLSPAGQSGIAEPGGTAGDAQPPGAYLRRRTRGPGIRLHLYAANGAPPPQP